MLVKRWERLHVQKKDVPLRAQVRKNIMGTTADKRRFDVLLLVPQTAEDLNV